jgi:hypothetical protein
MHACAAVGLHPRLHHASETENVSESASAIRRTYIPHPFLEFESNFDNASERERRTSYAQRMSAHRTLCFSGLFFLITTSCELGGLFLTLVGEPQGFRFPARRAAHTHPAPRFPGAETSTRPQMKW